MKKQIVVISILAVLLVGGGVLLLMNGKDAVARAETRKQATLTADQANAVFQGISGKVAEIKVEKGAAVKKGDLLARLDTTETDLQIRQANVNLELLDVQSGQLDPKNPAAKGMLGLIDKQQQQLQLQLQLLQVQKVRAELTAPMDGHVNKISIKTGDLVASGTPAVSVQGDRLYANVYVNETQVQKFREGEAIPVRIPALDNQQVSGKLDSVEPASQFAALKMSGEKGLADVNMFQLRIHVDSTGSIVPGLTMEVNLNEIVDR
ncbi:efflux RND transporter periplasmic adaptor subunit [Paenibacillus alginolyticus]|uniref:efflux RND transporter periplasmic adaptor subunit n=1 Tax=Paenibacillus alginolyticus TaxID=59839 RepID=UPI00041C4744|nr:efflux RND transporter periplasmic adaptor subunit [Paenibacillus alginolyticus]MCY9668704.1 efflux RND transporter periplasmic adaptor subunit [Paenibacillus alginolyticus]